MSRDPSWILDDCGPEADRDALEHLARDLERRGHRELAATAWDRLYALDPEAPLPRAARTRILDSLALEVAGLRFRYVPAGTFLMGSEDDHDEWPVHPVRLSRGFHMSETCVSWGDFCRIRGFSPPPDASPPEALLEDLDRMARFHLYEEDKIRLQYCEDAVLAAHDWHAHAGYREYFGEPVRDAELPAQRYSSKPMIAVSWQEAEAFCEQLTRLIAPRGLTAMLPSEAQWEKAARGGLAGKRYAWGDAPPDETRCDFDRFGDFRLLPMRSHPPNGYGLFAMCGGVWEWTRDWYDARAYPEEAGARRVDPTGPRRGLERVLRGGSWADAAAAVTVSRRMSRTSRSWRESSWGRHESPNIGFRVILIAS